MNKGKEKKKKGKKEEKRFIHFQKLFIWALL